MLRYEIIHQGKSPRPRPRSAVEPLRHHLPVHDGDVDEEEQDDQEVVHEAQQAEQGLGQEVQRGHQVGEGAHQAQKDPEAKHPEQAAHGEELPEGVAQQGGHVAQSVHQLSGEGEPQGAKVWTLCLCFSCLRSKKKRGGGIVSWAWGFDPRLKGSGFEPRGSHAAYVDSMQNGHDFYKSVITLQSV